MDAFPAFFPLSGRTVAIAGSGEAAEAKLRLFEGSPATLRRLEGGAALKPASYAGAALAFIASADDAFAEAAAGAARAAHVPVNVVDRPSLCDFTTPAVIDRGEVVAAIGTGGASPMLATLLRHDIEARVPSCPAWSIKDLAKHLLGVHAGWTEIVEQGAEGLDLPVRSGKSRFDSPFDKPGLGGPVNSCGSGLSY